MASAADPGRASPQHLFVLDPLASLNLALDSSLRLMFELERLGHQIFVCEPRHLSWTLGDQQATAWCQHLRFAGAAVHFSTAAPQSLNLGSMAAIHMRKDPPYDLDYITCTWLLDGASHPDGEANGPKIYNSPQALRRYNEKLAIFQFPEDCRRALVSADPAALWRFIEHDAGGDAVLKPLTLFGGRGVTRIRLSEGAEAARQLLATETAGGQQLRLVQAFDPAIHDGEVRVFTAFGHAIAWCRKKPAPGQFLANTRMGAVLEAYTPSVAEVRRVTRVAKALAREGAVFLGFDLIGGYISEINLTSPRLLHGPDDHSDYYSRIAELVAADLGGNH